MDKPTHHITGDGTKISIKDMCIEWNVQRIFSEDVSYKVPDKWRGGE